MYFNRLQTVIVIFFISLLFFSCKKPPVLLENTAPDLDAIKRKGKITVITKNNSISYFVYKAEPMGFQYELLKLFTEKIDVKLEILVVDNIDSAFSYLKKSKCDMIAMALNITPERLEQFSFSVPYLKSRQVLIQHLPSDWKIMSKKQLDSLLIRSPLQLAGKKVYTQPYTSFRENLEKISYITGKKVIAIDSADIQSEELVNMVSEGTIQFAVCNENEARVYQRYYPNIDIATPISLTEDLGWAVNIGSDSLLKALNDWMSDFIITKKYKQLYRKYFNNPGSVKIMNSSFYSEKGNKISAYDNIIRKYSKKIGWDWRIIAALMYEESQFNNDTANYRSGASGIMQLMPATALRLKIDAKSTLDANIWAGVMYLKSLEKQFMDIPDRNERIKFVLAAYNAGIAHIFDARRLTKKYGRNIFIWDDNVEYYLRKKSNRKFYSDPVVYYGYYRGEETYNFVRDIMDRYQHYKNVIK
jgi:membrane-bound lytic murein transglycosylase F